MRRCTSEWMCVWMIVNVWLRERKSECECLFGCIQKCVCLVCACECLWVCVYVFEYVHVCVYVYVCEWVWVWVRVCACVCVRARERSCEKGYMGHVHIYPDSRLSIFWHHLRLLMDVCSQHPLNNTITRTEWLPYSLYSCIHSLMLHFQRTYPVYLHGKLFKNVFQHRKLIHAY